MTMGRWTGMLAVGAMALVGCGGDDDDGDAAVAEASATTAAAAEAPAATDAAQPSAATASASGAAASPAGGGAGTVVIGGEAMVVTGTRCYLEEQEAAAGGGKILFVGQAFGTTADGSQELLLDVSRYDEDSMFAGDSISFTIGDPMSESARAASGVVPTGTVTVDDAGMRATDVAVMDDAAATEVMVTFDFAC